VLDIKREISMTKPYVMPSPDDRSANDNSVMMKSAQILGLYNQNHRGDPKMQNVTEKVTEWYKNEAIKVAKWDEAKFIGNMCVLTANISKKQA
jgi:hypothetical protein